MGVVSGQTSTVKEIPVVCNLTEARSFPPTDKLAYAICEMPVDDTNVMEGETPFENDVGGDMTLIHGATAVGGEPKIQLSNLHLHEKF